MYSVGIGDFLWTSKSPSSTYRSQKSFPCPRNKVCSIFSTGETSGFSRFSKAESPSKNHPSAASILESRVLKASDRNSTSTTTSISCATVSAFHRRRRLPWSSPLPKILYTRRCEAVSDVKTLIPNQLGFAESIAELTKVCHAHSQAVVVSSVFNPGYNRSMRMASATTRPVSVLLFS